MFLFYSLWLSLHLGSFLHIFSLPEALQLYSTDPICIMDVFHNFLMSIVDVLVKSFVFDEVIATMLTDGNRNDLLLIHHLYPNHD